MKLLSFATILFSSLFFCQTTNNSEQSKEYVKKFIYELKSVEPNSYFEQDSIVLSKYLSNVKILGLGEASHGSSEIFKIKDKITRYFLSNNGGLFTWEASMAYSKFLNDFSIFGDKDIEKYLMNIGTWIYQTDENLEMLKWIKSYNTKNVNKIYFSGFDMTTYKGSIIQLSIISNKYNLPLKELENISKNLITYNQFSKKELIKKRNFAKVTIDILDGLEKNIQVISDPNDVILYNQNLDLLRQFLDLTYEKRNFYMAKNIEWQMSNNANMPILIWAHNNHLKKTGNETGKFLFEKFKDNYINIGTFFYEGFNSVVVDDKIKSSYVEKPSDESLEEYLNSFNIPILFLDLKGIKKENNPLAKKLLSKIKYRTVGAKQSKNDNNEGNISNDFDYIIFVKKSNSSKLLEN